MLNNKQIKFIILYKIKTENEFSFPLHLKLKNSPCIVKYKTTHRNDWECFRNISFQNSQTKI